MESNLGCADGANEHVEFKLPFEPYASQRVFMRDAYECFEKSRFGLFESPTGSGKTISVLCSALTWLKNNRVRDLMCRLGSKSEDETVPKWVRENVNLQLKTAAEEIVDTEQKLVEGIRQRIQNEFDVSNSGTKLRISSKRFRQDCSSNNSLVSDVDLDGFSTEKIQIVICSRTFTQLNQYVNEFRRLGELAKNVKLSIAAGRFQVCVNDSIRSKCNVSEELNDECRRCSCEYRRDLTELVESSICFPMNIEELNSIGKSLCACPYYSSLRTLPLADLVLAPYVSVMNESLRQSIGIRAEGNIIIFDEAHNLGDAITEAYSSSVRTMAMTALATQCRSYLNKFRSSMNPSCVSLIESIIYVSDKLGSYSENNKNKECTVVSVSSFIVSAGLETVKFHEILNFLCVEDFCRKLKGWAERQYRGMNRSLQIPDKNANITSKTNAIYNLREFVSAILTSCPLDSVLITESNGDMLLELFSVSGDEAFHNMARKAHCVLLMSGTLSPLEEFLRLVPSGSEPLIHNSSQLFGPERLFAFIVDSDEYGNPIKLDYLSRGNERELSFICNLLDHVSDVVPNGIVCFFSSYNFLGQFRHFFETSSARFRIVGKKRLFFESQGKGLSVLEKYSESAIESGAILFAVFGGAQSEGINFADGLARMVLLIGQPYPPETTKLRLKREYFLKRAATMSGDGELQQRKALETLANQQRTLLCYKAVNQSVGRAMRHKMDFSAIVMIDSRYRNVMSQKLLSKHLTDSLSRFYSVNTQKGNLLENLKVSLKKFYDGLAGV